ncbi:MAG: hypothetical protein Q7S53_02125 [bacterium]|nr:hypothetical protein [bacterium]
MNLNSFLGKEYLFATNEKFKYWYVYLVFFGVMVSLAFIVSIFLKRHDDYKAKKSFEKQFFWTYLLFGFLGLTSLFARSQNLPIFGARIFTFVVIGLFVALNVWLLVYYFKVTKKEQLKFAQKKRKEKWLKKK